MPTIEIRDLTVSFDGHRALSIPELDLPDAAVTALIGPNGSGKSTLLNTLVGLIQPTTGTVLIDGESPADARSKLAYVMQRTEANRLLPMSVYEVVMMGRYQQLGLFGRVRAHDREIVERSMERLQIVDLSSRQLRELSGGQRQRALVAQGLAQQADALFMDEPITGLDLVSIQLIRQVIAEERNYGRTIVVTTHDLRDAKESDHAVLVATDMIASGVPEHVLRPKNLMAAYGQGLLLDDDHRHGHDPEGHRTDPSPPGVHRPVYDPQEVHDHS